MCHLLDCPICELLCSVSKFRQAWVLILSLPLNKHIIYNMGRRNSTSWIGLLILNEITHVTRHTWWSANTACL